MRHENATSDEPFALYAGYCALTRGDFFEDLPPLMRMLNALPLLLAKVHMPTLAPETAGSPDGQKPLYEMVEMGSRAASTMLYGSGNDADRLIFLGRLSSLACCLLTILGTARLGRLVGGWVVGGIAPWLIVFSPIFVAYGRLIKEDTGLTAALTWCLIAVLGWRRYPTLGRAALIGFWLGVSLLMKPPAAAMLPIIGWAMATRYSARRALNGVIVALVAWLVIVGGYAGTGLSLPHHLPPDLLDAAFPSTTARHAASATLAWVPVPAPLLITGLSGMSKPNPDPSEAGVDHFGRSNPVAYALAFVAKSTEGFLVLLVLATWCWTRRSLGRHKFLLGAGVLFTVAILIVTRSAQYDMFGGIRYMLPVLPWLCVVAARPIAIAAMALTGGRAAIGFMGWAGVGGLALHLFAGAAGAWHPIAYGNLLVGGTLGAHRWMTGTDVNWGQDLKSLARYVEKSGRADLLLAYHGVASPDYYGLQYQDLGSAPLATLQHSPTLNSGEPRRELLAVTAFPLMGVINGRPYPWTGSKVPETVIGGTFLCSTSHVIRRYTNASCGFTPRRAMKSPGNSKRITCIASWARADERGSQSA